MFGSAELSGVDSGSGVVEFSGSGGAMVDALKAIKNGRAIVCLQLTRLKSKRLLFFFFCRENRPINLSEFASKHHGHAKSTTQIYNPAVGWLDHTENLPPCWIG